MSQGSSQERIPGRRAVRRALLSVLAAALVAAAAACGASSGGAGAAGGGAGSASAPDSGVALLEGATLPAPSAGNSCALPDNEDLLVRYISAGLQPNAQELGEVQLGDCTPTLEYLKAAAANGAGDCTQVAWAKDNPGYNADAVPAPPLKNVIESIGPGC